MSILVGTQITCPECSKTLLEVIEEIYPQEMVHAHKFKAIGHRKHGAGALTQCEFCHSSWFTGGKIHTEKGWEG